MRVVKAPGGWVRLTVRDWGRGLDKGLDGGSQPAASDGAGSGVEGAPPTTPPAGRGPGGSSLRGGLGLSLVASAVETLGGRMTTETNSGAHVMIEVPPS